MFKPFKKGSTAKKEVSGKKPVAGMRNASQESQGLQLPPSVSGLKKTIGR